MGAATGWTRASHQLYYLGTATVTTRNGISVSRSSVQAKRLFLIATKCGTCGSLNVFYNGKSVGIVNLSYEATVYQAIVPLPVPASFLTGSVLLTTRTAGKVYQIDGLAVRRDLTTRGPAPSAPGLLTVRCHPARRRTGHRRPPHQPSLDLQASEHRARARRGHRLRSMTVRLSSLG